MDGAFDLFAQQIADCRRCWDRLNLYEQAIVQVLGEQMSAGIRPTPEQAEALRELWEKTTGAPPQGPASPVRPLDPGTPGPKAS
jgi:hypothetical protein